LGKRSRKQRTAPSAAPEGSRKSVLKQRAAEASDVAERQIKQRPPAPWDPFPLTELSVFFGLVLLIVGAVLGGDTGKGLIAAGVVLACIGGLDTALREHFNGYRAHSGLLAGIAALFALGVSAAVFGASVPVRAGVGIGVFALLFPALRRGFIQKSGGRGVL
jgi:hypothetical protein